MSEYRHCAIAGCNYSELHGTERGCIKDGKFICHGHIGDHLPPYKALAKAYRFANGMVIAFDQLGCQMPEYQGRFDNVAPKIRADYPDARIKDGEMV